MLPRTINDMIPAMLGLVVSALVLVSPWALTRAWAECCCIVLSSDPGDSYTQFTCDGSQAACTTPPSQNCTCRITWGVTYNTLDDDCFDAGDVTCATLVRPGCGSETPDYIYTYQGIDCSPPVGTCTGGDVSPCETCGQTYAAPPSGVQQLRCDCGCDENCPEG